MGKGFEGDMAGAGRFTPLLGASALSPFYDAAIGLATREGKWRGRLVEQIHPRPSDRILDVGCGAASLALLVERRAPSTTVFRLNPKALDTARRKGPPGWRRHRIHARFSASSRKPLRPSHPQGGFRP